MSKQQGNMTASEQARRAAALKRKDRRRARRQAWFAQRAAHLIGKLGRTEEKLTQTELELTDWKEAAQKLIWEGETTDLEQLVGPKPGLEGGPNMAAYTDADVQEFLDDNAELFDKLAESEQEEEA